MMIKKEKIRELVFYIIVTIVALIVFIIALRYAISSSRTLVSYHYVTSDIGEIIPIKVVDDRSVVIFVMSVATCLVSGFFFIASGALVIDRIRIWNYY